MKLIANMGNEELKMLIYGVNLPLFRFMGKILYNNCFTVQYLLYVMFGPFFNFQSYLYFNKSSLKKLHPFFRHLLIGWCQYLPVTPNNDLQIFEFMNMSMIIIWDTMLLFYKQWTKQERDLIQNYLLTRRLYFFQIYALKRKISI